MGLRPSCRIEANGSDITAMVAERLVSLRIVDEAGVQSDSLALVLDNTRADARIELPPTGAELSVAIGYDGEVEPMGVFVVDAPQLKGPPDQVVITAKAAPMTRSRGGQSPIQSQRRRSFPAGTTLGTLVQTYAREHGLLAAVHESIAAIELAHVDQFDESDASVLTRVTRPLDAAFKVAGETLIVVPRGSAGLPDVAIAARDILSYDVKIADRQAAASVVAGYYDLDGAAVGAATAGSGEPVRRLRHPYPDQASAQRAVESELARSQRGHRTLSLSVIGSNRLQAESRAVVTDYPVPEVNGSWLLDRVEHVIEGSGYRCSIRSSDYRPNS